MEDEEREDNLIEDSPSLNRQMTIHNQLSKLQKLCNMDNIKKLYEYMQSHQQFSSPARIYKRASIAKARYSDIYKIKPREQQLLPIFREELKLPPIQPTIDLHNNRSPKLRSLQTINARPKKNQSLICTDSPKIEQTESPEEPCSEPLIKRSKRIKRIRRRAIDSQMLSSLMHSQL